MADIDDLRGRIGELSSRQRHQLISDVGKENEPFYDLRHDLAELSADERREMQYELVSQNMKEAQELANRLENDGLVDRDAALEFRYAVLESISAGEYHPGYCALCILIPNPAAAAACLLGCLAGSDGDRRPGKPAPSEVFRHE